MVGDRGWHLLENPTWTVAMAVPQPASQRTTMSGAGEAGGEFAISISVKGGHCRVSLRVPGRAGTGSSADGPSFAYAWFHDWAWWRDLPEEPRMHRWARKRSGNRLGEKRAIVAAVSAVVAARPRQACEEQIAWLSSKQTALGKSSSCA